MITAEQKEAARANVLSLLVTNRFGVLTKVTTLFGRRGCNIHSLAVDITHNPAFSRVTVTVLESQEKVEQIYKQLQKLEDVKAVTLFREGEFIEREVMLLELKPGVDAQGLSQSQDDDLRVITLKTPGEVQIIEVMGTSDRVTQLILELGEDRIEKLSRSGRVALSIAN